MDLKTKEVLFGAYCDRCKHKDLAEEEDPCYTCLATPYNEYSHKPVFFEGTVEGFLAAYDHFADPHYGFYKTKKRLDQYLYELEYDTLDYSYAKTHYASMAPAGCTAVRKENVFGRNFDWTYNNLAEFVVHTTHLNGRHASLGVAGSISKLTDEFAQQDTEDPIYKIVPFQLQDGVNECGVFCSINVVPNDYGSNNSIPEIKLKETISSLMLIRFVLDNFSSAQAAVQYIRDYVSVIFPDALHNMGYEVHYMIGDRFKTFCLEFIDARAKIIDISKKPIMTNFHLYGVEFNPDGSVYTPATQDGEHDAIRTNHITAHGSGLERYNLANEEFLGEHPLHKMDLISNFRFMEKLLDKLYYTRAYPSSTNPSDPFWYTEFVDAQHTVASPVSSYSSVVATADNYYRNRTREDGKTWQTVHRSVYDLQTGKLFLITQENDYGYAFRI